MKILNYLPSVFKNTLKKSSMPAISNIGHAETIAGKLVWTLVLIAVILGYIFHVMNFTNYYREFPVIINLEVETRKKLDFPAITVCNWNRINNIFEDCIYEDHTDDCPLSDNPGVLGGYSLIISDRKVHFSGSKVTNFTAAQKFLRAYFSAPAILRRRTAMSASEFIDSCTFQGQQCSWEDFDATLNYRYGMCFTFNKRRRGVKRVLETSQTGIEGGLQLTLNFQVDLYVEHTPVVGGRIIIHHPLEIPEAEEQGISVSPGFETTIGLRQELIKRLPTPYKDECVNYSSTEGRSQNSQQECTKSCIQVFSHQQCGCADPTLTHSLGLKLCDLNNAKEMHCLDQALMNLSTNSAFCHCPLPCLSVQYKESVSYSKFPSRNCNFTSKRKGYSEDIRYQRANYGKINVFNLNFERKIFEQRPVFEDSELFSNLGGELDLWLGVSLFAIIELTEVFINLCECMFRCVKNRFKKTSVTAISENIN